jgi:hypothetical protein
MLKPTHENDRELWVTRPDAREGIAAVLPWHREVEQHT